MKRLLLLLFILIELASYGQAKIGMSTVLSFTPASAITPSSTVTYSTVVNFVAYVKNSGNATFTGSVSVLAKRDTTFAQFVDSVNLFTTLVPNDSISVIISFTPTPGPFNFKSGGNGNTIVVWPLVTLGGVLQGDSVRPIIWVNEINSVFEFEKNQFKLYPNPVIDALNITSQNNTIYKKIIIYDVFARKVKELSYKENIDVSDLTPGSYWMIISSEDKTYRVNFIKE